MGPICDTFHCLKVVYERTSTRSTAASDKSKKGKSTSEVSREDNDEVCSRREDDDCPFFIDMPAPSGPPSEIQEATDRVAHWVSSLDAVPKVAYDGYREHTLCNLNVQSDIFVHDGKKQVPARVLQMNFRKKEFKLHYYEQDSHSQTWRLTPNKRVFYAPFDDFIRTLQRVSSGVGRMENTRVVFSNLN